MYLAGDINTEMYLAVARRLDKNPRSISIFLNSDGGKICDGFAIYDRLKRVPKVTITATGDCSSAALMILQAAKIRRATPRTSFVCHLSGFFDPEPEEKEETEKLKTMTREQQAVKVCLDQILFRVYRERITEDNYIKALRQRCFGVEKALEYGFIDEVWNG